MIIVRAKYLNGQVLQTNYLTTFPSGGIFIPTRRRYELGTALVVDPRFAELRSRILVRGTVAWRRAGRRQTKLRAGIGVEFGAVDRGKVDYLLGVARGEIVDLTQRRHRRLPVEIRIDWRERSDASWQISSAEDFSEGGAFVRTTSFRPVGSTVILEFTAPGGERGLQIESTVAWTRHTIGEEGMGLEFRRRDIGGARLLKELVRRIETSEVQSADSDVSGQNVG